MSDQELRQWMKEMDLSQTEAAAILGIAYSTLSTFLRGARPSEETAEMMRERVREYNAKRSNPKPAA